MPLYSGGCATISGGTARSAAGLCTARDWEFSTKTARPIPPPRYATRGTPFWCSGGDTVAWRGSPSDMVTLSSNSKQNHRTRTTRTTPYAIPCVDIAHVRENSPRRLRDGARRDRDD
eukprot:gene8503-biopygen21159